MGSKYNHLDLEERIKFETLHKEGMSFRQIAQRLGRSASTLYRELNRYQKSRKGYDGAQAERSRLYRLRKRQWDRRKFDQDFVDGFGSFLGAGVTVEQVCQVYKIMQTPISKSHIYRLLRKDRLKGGCLWHKLIRPKPLRGWKGHKKSKRVIEGRVSILDRPEEMSNRSEPIDWEVDTVHSAGHQGGLVTIVERKSLFYIVRKVADLTSETVTNTLINMMLPYADKGQVRSITSDNGSEFAQHKRVSEALKCSFFFGRPHKSNDRARNEWSNGKLRQLFPKGSVFSEIPECVLDGFMHNHNTFPRKSHSWKSNLDVFLNRT